MEIRALRYFLETAREENMSQAAKRLYVSQSALSRQIKSLEEELGQKLFIRHSFHIELTEAGILLRKRAEDILKMVDKTCEEFQSLDDTISAKFKLAAQNHRQPISLPVSLSVSISFIPAFVTISKVEIRKILPVIWIKGCLTLQSLLSLSTLPNINFWLCPPMIPGV